jgi:ribosomal-protein-alanine N-acetyltransferase
MIETKAFNETTKPDAATRTAVIDFLHKHLEEFGDAWDDIARAVDYSLKNYESFGGFVLVSYAGNEISGVVVVNRTGMKGYIPDNILVYIATHNEMRHASCMKKWGLQANTRKCVLNESQTNST